MLKKITVKNGFIVQMEQNAALVEQADALSASMAVFKYRVKG